MLHDSTLCIDKRNSFKKKSFNSFFYLSLQIGYLCIEYQKNRDYEH
jgi:hypothetical protein